MWPSQKPYKTIPEANGMMDQLDSSIKESDQANFNKSCKGDLPM